MKVLIVTQEDPFYLPLFFREFFARIRQRPAIHIVGVVVGRALGKKSRWGLARQMLDFYGPYHFTLQVAKYAWRRLEWRLHAAGFWPRSFSIRYFVEQANCRILPQTDVNQASFAAWVRQEDIDLIVSVAASQIFRREILAAPRLGCINIHNAPLPDYRGMLPNFWQMYHGERYSVTTIHEMVAELDRGRILLQRPTEILPDMTLDQLIRETKRKSAEALVEALAQFELGQAIYQPHSARPGSYFSFPTREDVREFRRRGKRLI